MAFIKFRFESAIKNKLRSFCFKKHILFSCLLNMLSHQHLTNVVSVSCILLNIINIANIDNTGIK